MWILGKDYQILTWFARPGIIRGQVKACKHYDGARGRRDLYLLTVDTKDNSGIMHSAVARCVQRSVLLVDD